MPRFLLILLVGMPLCSTDVVAQTTLAPSIGHLAVKSTEADDWSIWHSNGAIPDRADLRTSHVGPVRVNLAGTQLHIDRNTRLTLDTTKKTLELLDGRIACQLPKTWTIRSGDVVVRPRADSEFELAKSDQGLTLVTVKQSVEIRTSTSDQVELKADQILQVKTGGKLDDVRKLSKQQREQLGSWKSQTSDGPGQMLVRDPQSGELRRLEIARYHVNVTLRPPVALVQIDQSFYNPYPRQVEGTFVFNLPRGASVSRFAMFVTPQRLIEGELIERKRASDIYESIVASRRDPAILEQIGTSLFRMRVFPIFARDTKRILLDYTVPLSSEKGLYHFELPLMSDRKPIWELQLTGSIASPVQVESVRSTTHPLLSFRKQVDGTVTFGQRHNAIRAPSGLSLSFRLPETEQPRLQTYRVDGADGPSQYFVATLPPIPAAAAKSQPTDVLILVDTSGSAKHLARSRRIVRTIIQNLDPRHRVRLACMDVGVRALSKKWGTTNSKETRLALRKLDEQFRLGGSDLSGTLAEAIKLFEPAKSERQRSIIHLGDGVSTNDVDPNANVDSGWMEKIQASGVHFNFVRVDNSDDASVLSKLAQLTGGRVYKSAETRGFFQWILDGFPVAAQIESLKVSGVAPDDLFHDGPWNAGEPRLIYGRHTPQKKLRITCQVVGGETEKFRFRGRRDNKEDDVFVGRLWAQRKIERLLHEETQNSDSQKKNILRLAQEWSLMSPHTAFLVLETEADYSRYKIDRRVRHRYWQPALAVKPASMPERVQKIADADAAAKAKQKTTTDLDQKELQAHLAAARDALDKNEPSKSMLHLLRASSAGDSGLAKEYLKLVSATRQMLSNDRYLTELGVRRSLLQRDFVPTLQKSRPQLFAMSFGGLSPGLLQIHPHARALLKPIRIKVHRMDLGQFRKLIQQETGLNVLFDEIALGEEGIAPDGSIDVRGLQSVTLRSLLKHALRPLGLSYYEEPHMLWVTTVIAAEEMMRTRTYRAADLVRTDVLPDATQLFSPFADVEARAHFRINNKLERLVNVDFQDKPLKDALEWLRVKLDDNFLFDRKGLIAEGIAHGELINLKLNQVPIRVALEKIGRQIGLTWTIAHESVVVTTTIAAEEYTETRVYPSIGLLYRLPFDDVPKPWWDSGGLYGNFGYRFGGGMYGWNGRGGGGAGFGGGFSRSPRMTMPLDSKGLGGVIDPRELQTSDDPETIADKTAGVVDAYSLDGIARATTVDVEALKSLLASETTGPWQSIEGTGGTIGFHIPSMSTVIRQSPQVHRELEALYSKLRRLPVDRKTVRRRGIPRIGADSPRGWDMTPLMELLMNETVGPWQKSEGTGGTFSPFSPAMALTIRQTQAVHEDIEQLLAQLRRARYVAETIPAIGRWDPPDLRGLFLELVSVTQFSKKREPRESEVTKLELQLLEVRQACISGSVHCRHVRHNARQHTDLSLAWENDRLEFRDSHRLLRSVGENAAAAYPELGLVEIDRWGAAVRDQCDAWFPWMLHRSNEELARMFDVTQVLQKADITTLRFSFPDRPENYILASFDKGNGLPTKWSAYVKKKLEYRLVFQDLQTKPRPTWNKVVAYDATDREIERWELNLLKDAASIRDIRQGWSGFVIDDRLLAGDSPYQEIRRAIRELRSTDARKLVEKEMARRPDCPLHQFLLAWILEYGGSASNQNRAAEIQSLETVADSGAIELVELINARNFSTLDDRAIFNILLRQPLDKRTARNWKVLAELAAALGKPEVALRFLDRTVGARSHLAQEIQLQRTDLLLEHHQPADARKVAAACIEQFGPNLELLAQLGDIFASHNREKSAFRFYERCLEAATDADQKHVYGLRLARWLKGAPRWRLLLQAVEKLPANSSQRRFRLRQVVSEMRTNNDALIAARFAETVTDPVIRQKLLIRQVELTADAVAAAKVCVKLFENVQLPKTRLTWAVEVLSKGDRHRDVVRVLESHLHKGDRLTRGERTALVHAYNQLGRTQDAQRAATDELDRTPRTDPSPQRSFSGGGFF